MIVTRKLISNPKLDPLSFVTVQGEDFTSINMGKGATFSSLWTDTMPVGLKWESDQNIYFASENYNNDGSKGWVTLTHNGQEIYRIDIGEGSPITALRGLWIDGNHWVLETAHVTNRTENNVNISYVLGQISEDGVLLNQKLGYEEAFNYQTINGKPFYFFKRNGVIDASYDGNVIMLGYDEIPHYGCCSPTELNPHMWTDMVAFFGIKNNEWYFVQIGVSE